MRDVLLCAYRGLLGLSALWQYTSKIIRWWWRSRETTNYTYDLTPLSRRYLVHFLADATGADRATVAAYIAELEEDEALRQHIRDSISASTEGFKADREVRYGKRLGWYALARILKPTVVVETGVDKGLGSVVLAAALLRNAAEGKPGYYFGTDINPRAGYLLSGKYATIGQILYGDSIESLCAFDRPIDLFINDSDHSATYEAREYETIANKLSPQAVILGDNCELTDALCTFAEATGRRFIFWREEPSDHWFPGGGIGLALRSIHAPIQSPTKF